VHHKSYEFIKTKQTLNKVKATAKYQVSTSITTRSPLILRDMDVLDEIPNVTINISMNTLNVGIMKKLEPATSFPIKRLETISTLNAKGIQAGVFIAPILPMITDSEEDLDALFAAAKAHQSAFAMASVLRLSADVKPLYYQTLQAHFPQLVSAYNKLFNGCAYATKKYVDDIHIKTNQLMQKYELVNDVRVNTRHNQHIHEPSRTQQVEVEQLSFNF
jgi:DNA repair photolyase